MTNMCENKLENNRHRMPARRVTQRVSWRAIMVAALALVLACGVAAAAINWNSRQYLTYTDKEGQTHVNEELADLAQPVSKSFEGSALGIDIQDAIFDGRSLVLTWTMRNKQTEGDLYLLLEQPRGGSVGIIGQGGQYAASEVFVGPGEVLTSGMTTLFDSPVDMDTLPVEFSYVVLEPTGEVVPIGGLADTDDVDDYRRHIDELNAQGKLVLAPDGVIELGSSYPENVGDMTYAEILVAAGKMRRIETVNVSFTVERNGEVKNLLPDGLPIEKDNGDYILRVVKAELSPNSATFVLERVFENREAAERFAPYYSEKLGPYWGFDFQDETNSNWFGNGGGSNADEPTAAADGTWVWAYEYTMTHLMSMPGSITIVPQRDDPDAGLYCVPYPEEAIVLNVP